MRMTPILRIQNQVAPLARKMHCSLKLETKVRMKFKFQFTLVRIAGETNDTVSGADTDFTFKDFLTIGGIPL